MPLSQKPANYFRVAWQSALAAGLSLGLPAGLLFWLILFREVSHFSVIERFVTLLQVNGLRSIFILASCSLLWSFLLGRISGYRPWWKIGLATIGGILVGWFSSISNLDSGFDDRLPVHMLYALFMSGVISSVTICVGLAYGWVLRSVNAALRLALGTSIVSVLTALLAILLMDQLGIRVGEGDFAMSKVTVVCLLTSAITGGMVLGVEFSRFVQSERHLLFSKNITSD